MWNISIKFAAVQVYACRCIFMVIFLITLSGLTAACLLVLLLVVISGGIASVFGVRFRTFFRRGLWFVLLPLPVFAYGCLIERNIYNVKEVEIISDGIPKSFDGYRIVQLSDIHLSSFQGRARSLERAVHKVNGLDPDVILFTGDLVTFSPDELDRKLSSVLSGLKAEDGVYSVLGNHDYCTYTEYASEEERLAALEKLVGKEEDMGWTVLLDSCVNVARTSVSCIDGSLCRDTVTIAGVRNISAHPHFPSDGDLDKALSYAAGDYVILMSHDPTHWRKEVMYRDDVDIMLSGHTHAMQLAFFGWSPASFIYKEYSGLYCRSGEATDGTKKADRDSLCEDIRCPQYLYVNTGLGETGFPARAGVPPEITVFTLSCPDMP